MIMKIFIQTLLLLIATLNLFAQNFNPDERLTELTGKKENIGITAGYSVDGEIKWAKSEGFIWDRIDSISSQPIQCENGRPPLS